MTEFSRQSIEASVGKKQLKTQTLKKMSMTSEFCTFVRFFFFLCFFRVLKY